MHTTPEFALTRDDYRLLAKATSRRLSRRGDVRPVEWLLKFCAWIALSAGLFIVFRLLDRYPGETTTFESVGILLVLGLVLALLGTRLAQARVRHRLLADNGAFLRPHVLEFSDAALATRWSTGFAKLQWTGFVGKAEDAKNVYLFVDHCAAYVVPRSAVAGFQAEFERCVARIPAS